MVSVICNFAILINSLIVFLFLFFFFIFVCFCFFLGGGGREGDQQMIKKLENLPSMQKNNNTFTCPPPQKKKNNNTKFVLKNRDDFRGSSRLDPDQALHFVGPDLG